jgi:hypothetical protein
MCEGPGGRPGLLLSSGPTLTVTTQLARVMVREGEGFAEVFHSTSSRAHRSTKWCGADTGPNFVAPGSRICEAALHAASRPG